MRTRSGERSRSRRAIACLPMVQSRLMSTEELLAEALRLPRPERARVVEQLLASLEEPAEEVAAAWAAELQRRSREVAEGRVPTVAWETVRAEILNEIEQRRADRSSP